MDTLSSKVEHITSSLYSYILLWAPKLHFPLKNNNNQKQHRNGYCVYGLQTIVDSEERKPAQTILHCYNMAAVVAPKPFSPPRRQWKSLLSPPLSPVLQSTVMGDVIGTESGDYMISDVAEEEAVKTRPEGQSQSQQSRGREKRRSTMRQFRPPITLLRETRTMAWTFKREYSDDGGLIIRAERWVRRHGYALEAHRENGRLAMEAHSTDYYCEECGWPIDEVEDQGLDLECVESRIKDFKSCFFR